MRRSLQTGIASAMILVPCLIAWVLRTSGRAVHSWDWIWNPESSSSAREPDTSRLYSIPTSFDEGFSSMFKSVFPMDSVISYNTSNTSSHTMVARYASFSAILNHELEGKFAILPGNGCQAPSADVVKSHRDKIVIVPRGNCSFLQKVENLLDPKLSPKAIIIGNNIPDDELITMYHRNFNQDGAVKTPMLFISLEDYEKLLSIESLDITLTITTVSFDSIVGISLSMALSPPMMFLLFYLTIRMMQYWRQRRRSAMNERYVAQLPVYMYKGNHLIPCTQFYEYLKATNQTDDVTFSSSASEDLAAEEVDMTTNHECLVINGTDLYSLKDLGLLFSQTDYYATSKCSICLGRLVPLQSRVLLLRCKHMYHEKCLSNWLINFKKSCPLCNEMLHLNSEPANYGTFGRDLEAGDVYTDHDHTRVPDDPLSGSAVGDSILDAEFSAGTTNATPYGAHSYASMPILPNRSVVGSSNLSAASSNSFVTVMSENTGSGVSATSEYLTPIASISSGDDQTETVHSVGSTLTYNGTVSSPHWP